MHQHPTAPLPSRGYLETWGSSSWSSSQPSTYVSTRHGGLKAYYGLTVCCHCLVLWQMSRSGSSPAPGPIDSYCCCCCCWGE